MPVTVSGRRLKKLSRTQKIVVAAALAVAAVTYLPALRFQRLENATPLPESYSKGVFHVHSSFSDGKGDLEEITAAADGLDFIALTDHGDPNRQSAAATQRLNGVLVVGGSEISVGNAHVSASGFTPPGYRFPPEPQQTIAELNRGGGASFLAHPFYRGNPWADWSVTNHSGIELINAHTAASNTQFSTMLLVPRYFARPRYAMLTTLDYPWKNVDAWEAMNRTGRHSGIFALDAHARMSMGFGAYVHVPKYAEMFDLLNVYVKHGEALSDDPVAAARTLTESLRAGSFFNCIEAVAPANGFDAFFETDDGRRVEMGGQTASQAGRLVLRLPFEFETRIVVIRDGEIHSEQRSEGDATLTVPISGSGVWRVEVYATASAFDDLPWIMANPFFLGEREIPQPVPPPEPRTPLATGSRFFKVNHDATSTGSIVKEAVDDRLVYGMRYALPKSPEHPNFFVALTNRRPPSFTGAEGLMLRVRSDHRARFWLMFRTKSDGEETWYRHSFAADEQWSTVTIPFDAFGVHFGEDRPPDLSAVVSIHISINSRLARPGAAGTLFIDELALF